MSGGSDGKESACNARDSGSIPGSGRSPREGHGNPLQGSCLENPMDRGAWWASVHGVTESNATNTFTFMALHVALSLSIVSDSLWPQGLKPTRLLCPWGFSRQEYWSGLPCPPPGDLPNTGIKSRSPTLQADSLPAEPQGKPKNTGVGSHLQGIFLTQEVNQGLLHCRRILYQLSYQGSSSSVLEWVAMPSSRGSSHPRDQTQVSRIAGRCFTVWDTREAPSVKICSQILHSDSGTHDGRQTYSLPITSWYLDFNKVRDTSKG